MSAFAPYKRIEEETGKKPASEETVKSDTLMSSYFKFPIDLTSVLLALPAYQRTIFNISESIRVKHEESVEKKERFFIKNLLKSDEITEKSKTEITRKFEEEASKMETIVSNLGKAENGHKCIYCGKIYSRKYGLKIHIRTHTGYKPLKCKYCLRPFGDPSNLNKHVRLHARGQTPYKCRFCGKILVRRRDLERHIKSKHGEPS